MPAWSRTTKPSADTTIPAGEIFGVDAGEAAATPAIGSPGWVRRKTIGSRVQFETLVAMKTGPVEVSDDTEIPDFRAVFTTEPNDVTVQAPAAAAFSVVANTVPTGGSITYQWQISTNNGSTWANVSGATAAVLNISNSTGLNGNQYRCIVSVASGTPATSRAAILTVTV